MPTATRPIPDQESNQVRRPEGSVIGGPREPREAERCHKQPGALVSHPTHSG